MPGIEARAPERTEKRSGFFALPKVAPMTASTFRMASPTPSLNPSGKVFPRS